MTSSEIDAHPDTVADIFGARPDVVFNGLHGELVKMERSGIPRRLEMPTPTLGRGNPASP